MCRPEAFKVINNSVLLYLTLSLVKKRKKKINKIHPVWEHLKQIPKTQPEFEFTSANFFLS